MILNGIFDFGIWLFELISSSFPSMGVALYNVADTLGDIVGFGIWVIGDNMWLVFMTSISAWLTFKLTWGIVLFVYRLIPFC